MKTLFTLLLLAAVECIAQQEIVYTVSFENAVHHEAAVTVTYTHLSPGALEARMSRSSPGRYALHEFAKNVYGVSAVDGRGRPLPVDRPNPHQWDVRGHDGTVAITYTLFADRADGTYSGIDRTHAHLLMPASFLWARGLDERPIRIEFRIPSGSGWTVATQLFPTGDDRVFTAPNLQYFMDSPTELAPLTVRAWTDSSGAAPCTIRLALHHEGTAKEADAYAAMARAVVEEEKAVFGELPAFDGGVYTFLADYLPYVSGDGMEHRNSTSLVGSSPLKTEAVGLLNTLAHEFFHAWNIERIRPRSLEPFNFEEANMSAELWFGEGFTSYYQSLIMHRAGMESIDRFARSLSGSVNAVINSPARGYFSAADMSRQAPFVDAATSVDVQNKGNTFLSYYTWGSALGLGLDLTLRTGPSGASLDDLMRKMWEDHGRIERPYTNDDVRAALGAVARDTLFASRFFREYIEGSAVVDYVELLAKAGFQLRKSKAGKASAGALSVSYAEGKAVVTEPTLVNTPWYLAGIDRKDRIFTLDGTPLAGGKDLDSVLARHSPGDAVTVEFEQRGTRRSSTLTLEENREMEVVPFERAGLPLTASMEALRAAWLGARAKRGLTPATRVCHLCRRSYPFEFEYCHFDGERLRITAE